MKDSRTYGPGTYEGLAQKIEQDGLSLSSMGEAVSLTHSAYKGFLSLLPWGRRGQIRGFMRKRFVYAFTDLHNFPGDIIFYHDLHQLGDRISNPTQKQLEEMLGSREEKGVVFSDDGSLRMVGGKHPTGELRRRMLSSHPNIIGQTGSLEVAYMLDEIAGNFNHSLCLFLPMHIKEPLTTVSALNSTGGLCNRLVVVGDNSGYNIYGGAFGVFKSAKGNS